jgi:hypothetical protein
MRLGIAARRQIVGSARRSEVPPFRLRMVQQPVAARATPSSPGALLSSRVLRCRLVRRFTGRVIGPVVCSDAGRRRSTPFGVICPCSLANGPSPRRAHTCRTRSSSGLYSPILGHGQRMLERYEHPCPKPPKRIGTCRIPSACQKVVTPAEQRRQRSSGCFTPRRSQQAQPRNA